MRAKHKTVGAAATFPPPRKGGNLYILPGMRIKGIGDLGPVKKMYGYPMLSWSCFGLWLFIPTFFLASSLFGSSVLANVLKSTRQPLQDSYCGRTHPVGIPGAGNGA